MSTIIVESNAPIPVLSSTIKYKNHTLPPEVYELQRIANPFPEDFRCPTLAPDWWVTEVHEGENVAKCGMTLEAWVTLNNNGVPTARIRFVKDYPSIKKNSACLT